GMRWPKLPALVAHRYALFRKEAPLLLNLPMLGANNLQNEDVVIVPMGCKTLAVGGREVEIRLKAMTELRCERPAQKVQLGVSMVQLVQYQRAAAAHVIENRLQPQR